jgi:hypothetical protein
MSSYASWTDIRAAHVKRGRGASRAVEAGKHEMLAIAVEPRLAEVPLRRPSM